MIRSLTIALGLLGAAGATGATAWAAERPALIEPPFLAQAVAAGKLAPVEARVPDNPAIVDPTAHGGELGQYGGELRMLIPRSRYLRRMVVYGYARLVGYDRDYNLVPDILESYKVEDGRIFTFKLRRGHKWSDGEPFTSEDFRYWWQDVVNNPELSPGGAPPTLRVDGEPPKVEFLDALTVRYSWSKPNPHFLPRLAGAAPLFIYRPAHYLKQFNAKYADPEKLKARMAAAKRRNWASLHNRLDNMYKFDNVDLPTLQPWRNTTKPPATRFVGARNPYFHRIDTAGRQLPYIDRLVLTTASPGLIPAQAGTGAVDLQALGIKLSDFTFLKKSEKQGNYAVRLWPTATGAVMALYPNLNFDDPVWRALFRDVRFRRAMSLAIDRDLINEVVYFGMANPGNNTVLPASPLYEKSYQYDWARYDPDKANALLDQIGLTERGSGGVRLLADGRDLEIIIETSGEDPQQTDVLELIEETWREVGLKLFIKVSQRDVFRNRIFAGLAQVSVWSGIQAGLAYPRLSPQELAPTTQQGLQWPKWGQYWETGGRSGKAPDLAPAVELLELNKAWDRASDDQERTRIWRRMLEIHAEQQFTIGIINSVPQPVVVSNRLHNVPEKGVYHWDPGAYFGLYRPDTFWFEPGT